MNGKYFVGKMASSFESYNPDSPITGIRLFLDDENKFEAGDMDGNVWEMENPYATQEMADNILQSIQGNIYKGYEATAAVLAPEAELGDGITIGGLYSVLAYRKVKFGPGHMSDISAPGDDEPDEEYNYVPKKERDTNRKLAQINSRITKTADEIRLEIENEVEGLSSSFSTKLNEISGRVEGLDGQFAEFKLTVDGFTVEGPGGVTLVRGSSIETGSIEVGSIRADQIQLTGAITWDYLDADVQSEIDDRGISEYEATTLITRTLVSSPNIAGGKFYALDETTNEPGNTWLEIGQDGSGNGGMILKNTEYHGRNYELFTVFNGDYDSGTISWKGYPFIVFGYAPDDNDNLIIHALQTWDFSEATVTGLRIA